MVTPDTSLLQRRYFWAGILLFKLEWLLLILGQQNWYLQVLFVLLPLQGWCLYNSENPPLLSRLLVMAVSGISLDWLFFKLGLFVFASTRFPLWLMVLWLCFSLALAQLQQWLVRWPLWAQALLGSAGGISSYFAAHALGAVAFGKPALVMVLLLGMIWALLLPLFIYVLSNTARNALPVLCGVFLLHGSENVRAEAEKESWRIIGSGEFRVLLFPVYHATLESPVVDFRFPESTPLRLTLRYEREITPEHIIAATREQWQLQKVPYSEAWLTRLKACIPTIAKGDRLSFVVSNPAEAELHFNDVVTCDFNDPDFIQRFIGIWLSERSTEPTLRAYLLGEKK